MYYPPQIKIIKKKKKEKSLFPGAATEIETNLNSSSASRFQKPQGSIKVAPKEHPQSVNAEVCEHAHIYYFLRGI